MRDWAKNGEGGRILGRFLLDRRDAVASADVCAFYSSFGPEFSSIGPRTCVHASVQVFDDPWSGMWNH